MDKKQKYRLAFLEEAEADGQGAFLIVTEEDDDVYRAVHSGRTYTAARLQALHDANEGLVVMNIGGGKSGAPPHPAANPRGRTLDDARRRNEVVGKRERGEALTPDQEGDLARWAAEDAEDLAAWQRWEEASAAQFAETVRRMDRLNARAHAKRTR
jgi:hypothetical protein